MVPACIIQISMFHSLFVSSCNNHKLMQTRLQIHPHSTKAMEWWSIKISAQLITTYLKICVNYLSYSGHLFMM